MSADLGWAHPDWLAAHVSADIPLAEASHVAEPRVKGWSSHLACSAGEAAQIEAIVANKQEYRYLAKVQGQLNLSSLL